MVATYMATAPAATRTEWLESRREVGKQILIVCRRTQLAVPRILRECTWAFADAVMTACAGISHNVNDICHLSFDRADLLTSEVTFGKCLTGSCISCLPLTLSEIKIYSRLLGIHFYNVSCIGCNLPSCFLMTDIERQFFETSKKLETLRK